MLTTVCTSTNTENTNAECSNHHFESFSYQPFLCSLITSHSKKLYFKRTSFFLHHLSSTNITTSNIMVTQDMIGVDLCWKLNISFAEYKFVPRRLQLMSHFLILERTFSDILIFTHIIVFIKYKGKLNDFEYNYCVLGGISVQSLKKKINTI